MAKNPDNSNDDHFPSQWKQAAASDDASLFRKELEGVKPLATGKHYLRPASNVDKAAARKNAEEYSPREFDVREPSQQSLLNGKKQVSGEDVSFYRAGIQRSVVKRMKQGKVSCEDTIDLHGQRVLKGLQNCAAFIRLARERGMRMVRIIHGRGHHSKEGESILKVEVHRWLEDNPDVLAYTTCHVRDGGAGAVYVLLKGA